MQVDARKNLAGLALYGTFCASTIWMANRVFKQVNATDVLFMGLQQLVGYPFCMDLKEGGAEFLDPEKILGDGLFHLLLLGLAERARRSYPQLNEMAIALWKYETGVACANFWVGLYFALRMSRSLDSEGDS